MLQIKLIESFSTVLESAGVMFPDEDEEGDFVVKVAKLVSYQDGIFVLPHIKLYPTYDCCTSNCQVLPLYHGGSYSIVFYSILAVLKYGKFARQKFCGWKNPITLKHLRSSIPVAKLVVSE